MKNYVITTTLPYSFGGRTKALLRRTRLLNQEINTNFILVSTNFNPNYEEVYKQYIEKEFVQPDTQFINIYDDLIPRSFPSSIVTHSISESGFKAEKLKKRNGYKLYKNRNYSMFKSFEYEGGQLKFIDYIRENTTDREYRDYYNKKGNKCRRIYYDENVHVYKEELFDARGKVYLTKNLCQKNGVSVVNKITLYKNYILKKTHEFESENDFFSFWYEKIIEEGSNVICDARKIDEALLNVRKNIKKIIQLHSNHKTISDYYSRSYIVRYANRADKIIFLTEEQQLDFHRDTNSSKERLLTIPHYIEETSLQNTVRNKDSICVISRLDPDKQIDHIILAFKKIQNKYPEKSLYIYGDGKDKKRLEELIISKGLFNSVKLMGRTENPDSVFQESAFSVFASKHEGVGLVILESLNNGCPVVGYHTNYGPSDMIAHKENGFLVKYNDRFDLEEKMDLMIQSNIEKMSLRAVILDRKFRKDSYVDNWKGVLGL
ncbi:glycosyltransferase [Halobacillus shinanisalinarum]|uniref:Glycosyltransferase n=1 Tax=Halobacillus shinanisalinarum TaxID=2932258 RepID=A0ABY4H1V4_9BACI|nr:glycosyltransferase [Halobacillus shinanisalinarum]UOQ94422.1 glycosyltransferase [Halobacillus shinanisalinarum]